MWAPLATSHAATQPAKTTIPRRTSCSALAPWPSGLTTTGRKLNPKVYVVAGDGRQTTKAARKADANAKKLIIQERGVLMAEFGIEGQNEIIECLCTTEAKCPSLVDIYFEL
mmetsp:Transcript_24184/g.69539  ORF Transcript_24184/g.69539 Transcript_24184/m.69539 type:complete len:112 (+) Transcript_24184:2422-2757(+)